MGIGKAVSFVLLFVMLVIALFLLYDILSLKFAQPVEYVFFGENVNQSSYDSELQFYKDMRFNHKGITYNFRANCEDSKRENMKAALDFLRSEVGLINFEEISKDGDIEILCGREFLSGEDVFVAGEGGPTKIINSSEFNVITKGKIVLYKESCGYNVELHELLHVFGFDHSKNPKSIMYNISSCNQEMTQDIIDEMKRLYSIQELPDLHFSKVEAERRGRYLDFDVEVSNSGLTDADEVMLFIFSGEKEVDRFELDRISFGGGKVLKVSNLKLPLLEGGEVRFFVDGFDEIQELDETNNEVILTVE
ncbi:MAG: matrixin family metalloprotease [archaeon]